MPVKALSRSRDATFSEKLFSLETTAKLTDVNLCTAVRSLQADCRVHARRFVPTATRQPQPIQRVDAAMPCSCKRAVRVHLIPRCASEPHCPSFCGQHCGTCGLDQGILEQAGLRGKRAYVPSSRRWSPAGGRLVPIVPRLSGERATSFALCLGLPALPPCSPSRTLLLN